MKVLKIVKRGYEYFYYVDSLGNIKDVLLLIEQDGYTINRIRVNFIYDDAIQIAPKKYTQLCDFLDELPELAEDEEFMETITYNAENGSHVRNGAIFVQDNVISCVSFDREEINKDCETQTKHHKLYNIIKKLQDFFLQWRL